MDDELDAMPSSCPKGARPRGAKGPFVTDTTFKSLGISEQLLKALAEENYETPTPIQAQAIPGLLAGEDMLGIAQTGTGKTAAFALPILQMLDEEKLPRRPNRPQAVILAPTRELAIQIDEGFAAYGRHLKIRHSVIFGGVGQHPQVRALSKGVDIVTATPGRLLDLYQQGHVKFDDVDFLVLDEADRMLDMGFINDVRKIVKAMPKDRQSLLFSATMPKDIQHLADEILDQPTRVEVTPQTVAVDRIEQHLYYVGQKEKQGLLISLLQDPALARVIVFTRTKHGANRVARVLEKAGIASDAIHGNKSQSARQQALKRFKSGDARVLVATDIAARGIDVDNVTHVVNFELPNVPESYVHRIGRTARAGNAGIALAFCDGSEKPYLRDIERLIRRKLDVVAGHGFEKPNADSIKANEDGRQQDSRQDNSKDNRDRKPYHGKKQGHRGGHKGGANAGQKPGQHQRSRGGQRRRPQNRAA